MGDRIMTTLFFDHVYIAETGCIAGPLERKGPCGEEIDFCFDDLYCGQKTFEQAEQNMMKVSVRTLLSKARVKEDQIDLAVASDLLNQLGTSHYSFREFDVPFVGMYGACSNSVLLSTHAALWVDRGGCHKVIASTSSHQCTAEKQFRYPVEYGVQKKETTTYTVSGAVSVLFQDQPGAVRCTCATIGRIVDWDFMNSSDMGTAMAPAAYQTIMDHFKATQTGFNDYDLVLTGDLSRIGLAILKDLFQQDHILTEEKLQDCGLMIYDVDSQPVFCGGSGCACSGLVMFGSVYEKMKKKQLEKVLLVATGALLNPVMCAQKQSIPCIAHAMVFEAVKEEL